MATAMSRAVRLVAILEALRDRPQTTKELATRFEVTPRTIRRDLVELQGEPLYAPLVLERVSEWRLA